MVIRDILQHLITHPDAKDTMQGILQWWLPGGLMVWAEGEVQEALDMLVARGWLTQRQVTLTQKIYGLNKEHVEAIQEFLRTLGSATDEPTK